MAASLGFHRYDAAIGATQPDFEDAFLPAARALLAGSSPYTVDGYFYSPLVAVILLPVASSPLAVEYWTALRTVAAIAACVLGGLACAPRGAWFRAGVVTIGALITLLWSWPATLDFWAGQVEMLVLLALCGAALAELRGHRFLSGLALGVGAVIKTWPALFGSWLLRAGARGRVMQWLGVAAAAATAIGIAFFAGGPQAVRDMITAPFAGSSQPHLAANSAWGLPRLVFSDTTVATPLLVSPALQTITTVALVLWMLCLFALALVRPGSAFVALFNIAFVVVLLLPVSHYYYVVYALPVLWWWSAQILGGHRNAWVWSAFVTTLLWWVAVFRVPPAGDGFLTTTWPSELLIFGASAIAATVSVMAAARIPVSTR